VKIIDAHMHFYKVDGFNQLAKLAGHENTSEHYLKACRENNVVMSIAMGNARGENPQFGGGTPRVPDLAGKFDLVHYNQPKEIAYCAGVDSDMLTPANAEKTAREFERYVKTPQCVGIKIYLGYNAVYAYDPVHFPLYELAQHYNVPVAFHTGDLAGGHGQLKYAHPLTIDDVAGRFPKVRFVICHCGNPWIQDAIEVASKNENVYIDMSGLLEGNFDGSQFFEKHRDYFSFIRMWMDYMGRYDKFMYGTDWPLINIKSYIDVMKLVIPEEHWQEFFYDNALHVYSKLKDLL
jgi:predicted TIM-barrel fold metal-dependent hydrolase